MSKPKEDIDINVPAELIKELLTESEWRMIKQRLLIINLLREGLSIRVIAARVGVGTDTVVRMSKKLRENKKLKEVYEKFITPKSSSKWVFGQVSREEEH